MTRRIIHVVQFHLSRQYNLILINLLIDLNLNYNWKGWFNHFNYASNTHCHEAWHVENWRCIKEKHAVVMLTHVQTMYVIFTWSNFEVQLRPKIQIISPNTRIPAILKEKTS